MASDKPTDVTASTEPSDDDDLDLRALAEDLAREAPLDEQRVAALRARIASGTYSSDPAEIGRKLLELEAALFTEPGTTRSEEEDGGARQGEDGQDRDNSQGDQND